MSSRLPFRNHAQPWLCHAPTCRCPKGLAPSKAIAQIKQSVVAGKVVTD